MKGHAADVVVVVVVLAFVQSSGVSVTCTSSSHRVTYTHPPPPSASSTPTISEQLAPPEAGAGAHYNGTIDKLALPLRGQGRRVDRHRQTDQQAQRLWF